jgi:hypothetical protein
MQILGRVLNNSADSDGVRRNPGPHLGQAGFAVTGLREPYDFSQSLEGLKAMNMLTDVEQRQLARDVRWISNKSRIPAPASVGCIGLIVVWFCVLTLMRF